jgi:biopolymer transport protein ExbD
MRVGKTRRADATFDLNLAPLLDVIVVIIPMLLLSVAFIQIKMIETNVPQVVEQKISENNKKDATVIIELRADKKSGFQITINDKGSKKNIPVALKGAALDFQGLKDSMVNVKKQYSDVFKLDFAPSSEIVYEDIVMVMDTVRQLPTGQTVAFMDTQSGKEVMTDLMFPDVTFSNVLGE